MRLRCLLLNVAPELLAHPLSYGRGSVAEPRMPARIVAALCLTVLTAIVTFAADPLADSAQKKLDSIGDGKAKPGSTIVLSPQEVNAWIHVKRVKSIPDGLRNEKIDLGSGTVD